MGGKQMEGDNERRRALARRAREQGHRPSEFGLTLGASKQPEHVENVHRDGPPPAGPHKHRLEEEVRAGRPPAARSWPHWDPAALGVTPADPGPDVPGVLRYRDLVADVAQQTGLSFDDARMVTEATVTALARVLHWDQRQRLLSAVPTALRDEFPVVTPYHPRTAEQFLDEVERMTGRPPEHARYQAQAVLSAIADRDPELVDSLDLPPEIRALTVPPPVGGGTVSPDGHTPPLTDDELRAALAHLPDWSGDRRALARTIVLPPANLDRVLERLERLRREAGRGPHIGRQNDGAATIVVRTSSIGAVTRLDIELAHRVDTAIDDAGAGMSAG